MGAYWKEGTYSGGGGGRLFDILDNVVGAD